MKAEQFFELGFELHGNDQENVYIYDHPLFILTVFEADSENENVFLLDRRTLVASKVHNFKDDGELTIKRLFTILFNYYKL